MADHTELRKRIIAAYGEGEFLAQFDALIAENERLRALEARVLQMASHLRDGFWWPSTETGAALEIHSAITDLHIDMEKIAEQRNQLAERCQGCDPAKRVAGIAS